MSEILVKDQQQIFGQKSGNIVMEEIRLRFEPHVELWTSINQHMSKFYNWLSSSIEVIDEDEVQCLLDESRSKFTDLSLKFD